MRIVTWNCQMGLDKKIESLLTLSPDIAVIPECSERSTFGLHRHGYQTLWFGSNLRKGLGVICRKDWPIRALQPPEQKWIVPIEVDSPSQFTMLAIWACRVGTKHADNYIGQVYQSLRSHPEWFTPNPVVVAGDLNSNKIWDHERALGNHSAVVKLLEERGLVSGYHEYTGEPQGEELKPTMHLYRHQHRPFHIDYVFFPREWVPQLLSVEIGTYERWSKLSDHCPVTMEIKQPL